MTDNVRIGAEPTLPPKPRRRNARLLIAAAAVLVAAGLVAAGALVFGGGDEEPTPAGALKVSGVLTLSLPNFIWDKEPARCEGYKGYDDIREGVQVVVTDGASKTVAIGTLRRGLPVRVGDRATKCLFTFEVNDVPAGLQFYGVEVSHRGRLQYTEAELGKALDFTLG